MRSRGGGVGLPQTIPGGRPLEPPGAGLGSGVAVGLDTTTAGVGLAVGEDELDPHPASVTTAAAQPPDSTSCLMFMAPPATSQEVE
jgi:hypothetical protein